MTSRRSPATLLVGLVVLCLGLVGACAWAGGPPREATAAARAWPSAATPRPLDVGFTPRHGGGTARPRDRAAMSSAHEPAAVRVLHAWDRGRARAYAAGSASLLRDLYLPASRTGRVDVRLLRDYRSRGFRVRGLRMQLLAVAVLAHSPGLWRLRVTDRLAHATAVRGSERVTLPRDGASTRVLTLRLGADGRWRMARVSAPGPR